MIMTMIMTDTDSEQRLNGPLGGSATLVYRSPVVCVYIFRRQHAETMRYCDRLTSTGKIYASVGETRRICEWLCFFKQR